MARDKIIRNICMGLFFFLSGVEYAVIIPTLNGYLKTFEAKQSFLGLVLSAFSLSGLIAAPIYGKITDKTKSTKLCVVIGNCFEIGGNFLYFASTNQYMVLAARLIAGVGSGVASSIFGMIARTTTEEERTSTFSLLMSLRQIGLIVGPAFNLFLHSLDFNIGHLKVDEFTSPGLLMAIIWFLHTLLILIIFKDIEKKPQRSLTVSNEYEEIGDEDAYLRPRSTSMLEDIKSPTFINEFLRDEVVVCLTITFMVQFAQTGIEAVAPPITLWFFDWGGLQNSYMFCVASVIAVVSFASLHFMSKRLSDRVMVLSGAIGMVITYAVFFSYTLVLAIGDYPSTPSWVLPIFVIDVAILTIALPYLWVPQSSLFSKVTSKRTQAFNQGIRLMSMGFGQILGPIWASSLVSVVGLPIMVGVDLFFMLMITAMIAVSYKRLRPRYGIFDEDSPYVVSANVSKPEADDTSSLLPKLNGGLDAGSIN